MTQYITYKDNKDKSRRYILKDGSYSKKLRFGLLKKPRVNGREMLPHQHFIQYSAQYHSVTVE